MGTKNGKCKSPEATLGSKKGKRHGQGQQGPDVYNGQMCWSLRGDVNTAAFAKMLDHRAEGAQRKVGSVVSDRYVLPIVPPEGGV